MNNTIQTPVQLLAEIHQLHHSSHYIKAADTLLDYLVTLLELDRMTDINELLSLLQVSLCTTTDIDLYDDNGLARIHNVLVLSLRFSHHLPARNSLRAAYKKVVEHREDRIAANRAVKYL